VHKDGRVCGSHYVATPDASRVDEGDPGTVLGTVSGETVLLLIKSTRNNEWHAAKAHALNGTSDWRLVGTVIAGDDDEPTIIPWNEKLVRDANVEQINRLWEIGSAPCLWPGKQEKQ
jgi:hypothetical protein